MPAQILENIRGADLPKAWQDQVQLDQDRFYTIIIEPVEEYFKEDMPPEEAFKEEFVKEILAREDEYKKGQGTLCGSKEKREAFFKSLLVEDDG